MKLSDIEFRAMNTLWRRWGHTYFEMPLFKRLGLDVKDKDVLEIGCGNGYGGYLLNQLTKKLYRFMYLRTNRNRLPEISAISISYSRWDRLSQFANNSKDVVIIFGVLHHIPEWRKVIDEIAHVVKPTGSLFLEEPRGMDLKFFDFIFRWGHADSDFGLSALEEHLKSSGFQFKKQWTPLLTMYHVQK